MCSYAGRGPFGAIRRLRLLFRVLGPKVFGPKYMHPCFDDGNNGAGVYAATRPVMGLKVYPTTIADKGRANGATQR